MTTKRKYIDSELLRLMLDIRDTFETKDGTSQLINALQSLLLLLNTLASAYREREPSPVEYILITRTLYMGRDVAHWLSLPQTADAIDATLEIATQHRPDKRALRNGSNNEKEKT